MTLFTFIDNMNFAELNLFLYSLFAVFIIGFLFFVEKVWPSHQRRKFNEIIIDFMEILGIVFAIIVGTVIVAVWKNYDDTKNIAMSEAGSVGDLYRSIPENPDLEPIRSIVLEYGKQVIDVEWPQMEKGIKPTTGWKYLFQIQNILNAQKEPSQNVQSMVTNLFDNRRLRIAQTEAYLPSIIYFLILFLSFLILLFSCLFGTSSIRYHGIMCLILALPICLTITTIIAIDNPYQTQIYVKPNNMQTVIYNLTHLSDSRYENENK